MILQKEFEDNGYRDLLIGNIASECEIDLEDMFDISHKPEELLSIFISKQCDELFVLLNGDSMNINKLCDSWDDKIRVFSIINGQKKEFHKLKYNIIQLIVCSEEISDREKEGDLNVTRKIIIKGDMKNINRIEIDDDEVIELPFHMISSAAFAPDEKSQNKLNQLISNDEKFLKLMETTYKRVNRKEREGILDKSLSSVNYKMIKEWLENDN